MALIKLGALAAEIRGSIGGTVFARNRGGQYIRNRSIPLNPSSARQNAVRSVFGNLSNLWSTTLTQSQRDAWELYAANVPLVNSLGESRNVTGLNMYQRANALAADTVLARIDEGPTEFTLGPTITPTITLDAAADTLSITGMGTYDPATDGTVGFLIQQGTPQQPGVSFFKSPFRKVSGSVVAVLPADLPTDIPLAFPIAVGQAQFIRTAAVTADGRVGVPVIQRFLVA